MGATRLTHFVVLANGLYKHRMDSRVAKQIRKPIDLYQTHNAANIPTCRAVSYLLLLNNHITNQRVVRYPLDHPLIHLHEPASLHLESKQKSSAISEIGTCLVLSLQSTPNNSNLQGKLKKVRVIGSSSYRG